MTLWRVKFLWISHIILVGILIKCSNVHCVRVYPSNTAPRLNLNYTDSEEELTDSEVFRHKPPKNKPPYGNYGQGSVPKCSRYEEYSSCGPLCEDDCSNKCQGQATGCKKGCFCKNGYVRHSTGSCIPIASCLKYTCPRNEEWKECGEAPYCEATCGYQARNCDDSIQCPGCFCRKGYYRHPETYACVTYNQCPLEEPQCPAGEVYKPCGYSKDEQCQFYGGDYYSEKCKPGCYCINGYVRIDNQCVPKYKCPKLCPANEEYSSCGNSCKESCSTTDSDCHRPCESGCFCISGYKRVDGVCVQKSYCPPPKCQGPNEIYIPCGKSCYEDCSKSPKDCSYETCTSGCYCKPNYKRVNGECVPQDNCPPPECPVYEVYSSCGNPCYDECGKSKSDCQSGKCYAGCYCEKGFKRIDGVCVPESKCESSSTKCNGQNEIYKKCGKSCYEDCSKSQKDCLYETCYSGCFCKPRYKRVDGACIPEKECPAPECPPYEVYITCGNSCYDECGKTKSDCPSGKCYEGCYCQDGYKRIDGVCVPEFKCEPLIPKCQNQNEIYKKCGKTCYEDCSKTQKDCFYEACTSGCFCKPHFKRVDGNCVPEDKCPPPECPAHEVYSTCGNSCYDECGKSKSDCQSGKCYEGCYCQDGYKRIDGVCVPKFKCEPLIPKCQGQNEIYKKCGKTCYEDCSKTQKDCFYETCFSGCFCKPNFKRVDGECVPQDECPSPECPVYEIYSTCGNSCYDECGKTKSDCQSDKCFAGCYCQKGFKRIDGVCVPEYKCGPPKCLLPNEVYNKCGRICDEQCNSVHFKCLRENCFSGCFCSDGYKRIGGACLPESTCPPAPCGPNEIYSKCGRKCDEECNIFNNPCKTELCYPGCFCQEGFTRINGSCVPESLCKCPYNERYAYSSECSEQCLATPKDCEGAVETFRCSCKDGYKRINGLCLDENLCQCSENEEYAYGNPCREKCGVGPQDCKGEACYKGCFCREGYRRVNGKCVAESQCPCGKYEEYTYGNDCYEECSKDPKLCRSVETYKKCTCIEGYKRIYGYCMPDTKCKCLVNEIVTYSNDCYEQCGTDPAKCAEQDTIRGCACRPGYVRINGQCVPDSECPCSFNEEYVVGNSCEEECNASPDSCKEVSSYKRCSCRSGFKRIDGLCTEQFSCPCGKNEIYKFGNPCSEDCSKTAYYCDKEESYQGCFCKEGYKRINGKCVEYSACKCGSNEMYTYGNYCDESCDNTLTCDSSSTELRCVCLPFHKRINGVCVHQSNCKCGENEEYRITEDGVSQCVCKDGYRKERRKCVPYNETTCGPNEISSTSNECTEQCGTDPTTCGPAVAQPRCLCQPGYVRINDVCVPRSNCQCGVNEEYTYSSECIERCEENEDTCKHEVQYERCTCLKSYKRIDGVCEPDTKCGCPENEHLRQLNECFESCGTDPLQCTRLEAVRGCTCDVDYVRVDGKCVLDVEACTCPENEEYKRTNDCLDSCDKTVDDCANDLGYRRCGCIEGFKRIDGQCVNHTNCPCEENEEYGYGNECFETCGTDPIKCGRLPTEKRCVCKKDHVRIDGNCVPISNCECGENEEYTSSSKCIEICGENEETCKNEREYRRCTCLATYKRIDGNCVPDSECGECPENEVMAYMNDCLETCGSDPADCAQEPRVRKCFCILGYERIDGKCVDSNLACGTECPKNEEYKLTSECHDWCNKTRSECDYEYRQYRQCGCNEGFKRFNGECLEDTNCPCPDNEEFGYGNDCFETCGTDPLFCALFPTEKRCVCKEGHVRIGTDCVPYTDCPCGENEHYRPSSECIEKCGENEETCQNENQYWRCTCLDQHKRIDGTCLPDTECECPDNEHMDNINECFESCGTDPRECIFEPLVRRCACANNDVRVGDICIPQEIACSCPDNEEYRRTNDCYDSCNGTCANCTRELAYPRCSCIEGFKRIDGVCVNDTNCPCKANEVFDYGNECFESCGTDPLVCALLPTEKRCVCNADHVRIGEDCVPDSQCMCEQFEEYTYGNECIEDCEMSNSDCRNEHSYKRCTCLNGYKRIGTACVPDTDCTCDTNEAYRYGSQCLEDCRNTPADCTQAECERGCFCAEGFKRFGETCLPQERCECGDNEEYRCDWDCNEDCEGLDLSCLLSPCTPGCYCIEGTRRINGECVDQNRCTCRRGNEVFTCGRRCAESCDDIPDCSSEPCVPGCYCRQDHHRRINNICRSMSACVILENTGKTLGQIEYRTNRTSYATKYRTRGHMVYTP